MKPGKPEHIPTEDTRRRVKLYVMAGNTHLEICKFLGIGSTSTLHKYYKDELTTALSDANAAVAGRLYRAAVGDGNIPACIFWLKTRAGWKETIKNEHTGAEGKPIESKCTIDFKKLSNAALKELDNARIDKSK